MRKKHVLTILLIVFLYACKDREVPFAVENDPFKVFPTHMVQNVLLENMVSESKTESVENSFLVKELEQRFGKRLIVVNLHKQDWLETPYSNELANRLGGFLNYPRASVNRSPAIGAVQGDDSLTWIRPLNWDFAIEQALAVNAQIGLGIESRIEGQNGTVTLYVASQGELPKNMRIGLYMVENNIQSIFQQGSNENFLHEHVMKNALTDIEGDTITFPEDNSGGQITRREYSNIDLKFYALKNLDVVAYIFHADPDPRKIKIYNAVQVKFGGTKFWNQ